MSLSVFDWAYMVYRVLVDECGADPSFDRFHEFAISIHGGTTEYRFQGELGFGGKFYLDNRCRVDNYSEDKTPAREAMIRNANQRLAGFPKKPR